MKRIFAVLVLLSILLPACRPISDTEQAKQALIRYFDFLSNGDYSAAADLYGGSYETLLTFNPDLNPEDQDRLVRNGCQVNGLQCLQVKSVTLVEQIGEGEFVFSVEFAGTDGRLFVQEGCCGADETKVEAISQFDFRVVEFGTGNTELSICRSMFHKEFSL